MNLKKLILDTADTRIYLNRLSLKPNPEFSIPAKSWSGPDIIYQVPRGIIICQSGEQFFDVSGEYLTNFPEETFLLFSEAKRWLERMIKEKIDLSQALWNSQEKEFNHLSRLVILNELFPKDS